MHLPWIQIIFSRNIKFLEKMGTMDSLIAPINNIKFDIEVALEQQLGAQPLPFPGMDSKFSLYKPSIRQCKSSVC